MWGTPRDLALINKIETKYGSIDMFLHDNHMIYAEGVIEGKSKQKDFPKYLNWPLIIPQQFEAFSQNLDTATFVKSAVQR